MQHMKRFLYSIFALLTLAACTETYIEEQEAIQTDTPDELIVSFEGGNDTRIQLNEAQKTVWTKGDLVSVFYRSDANQKWQYQGWTGSRIGNLKRVSEGTATTKTNRIVVAYPYNENYYFNAETYNIEAMLPATQHYLHGSYGLDGNIMVSSSEFNQFELKNVCGWLKLQLTGAGKVKSITLNGRWGMEQVAGLIYINSEDASCILGSEKGSISDDDSDSTPDGAGGVLVFDDTIHTQVTLDCDEGVSLSQTPKAFYIALPPMTFSDGLIVTVESTNGEKYAKATTKEVIIERNTIQPMAAFDTGFDLEIPNNQIWYTSESKVDIYDNYDFGANIESHTYDAATREGVITFDGDVTTISQGAFSYTSITSVTLPGNVTHIGAQAFTNCSNLERFQGAFSTADGRCLIHDGNLIAFAPVNISSYTIPDGVKTIGAFAFMYAQLDEITIPEGVTSIGDCAFYGNNMTEITLPQSTTSLGRHAFMECYYLTNANLGDAETIGFGAFGGCYNLEKVTLGNGTKKIGISAFEECSKLCDINFPTELETIDNYAFTNCTSLTNITLPERLKSIGSVAFGGCSNLSKITCSATTPPAGSDYMFDGISPNVKIYVPSESLEDYKSAQYWSEYAAHFEGQNTIPANNEIWYTSSTGDIIEVDATSFGGWNYSFSSARAPQIISHVYEDGKGVITFDEDIYKIGYHAFSGQPITTITLPNSIEVIGPYAFSQSELTTITIPNSVTTLDSEAFYYCFELRSVFIPDSVTSFGEDIFAGCIKLREINCQYATTDKRSLIVNNVFIGFAPAGITEYTIPAGVTKIGWGAFKRFENLKKVTIPEGVTLISSDAFYKCNGLESITIPSSVTTIGWGAFHECNNLMSVYCKPATPPTISDGYYGVFSKILTIYVPNNSITAYKTAYGWSYNADNIVGYNL